jgi:regulator of chromosome condensation
MVRFPRVVYSLRDKKVCGIACGGLHNAVYTEEGLVFTWGCADDGSLGREGDESIPLLVEALAEETVIGVACGDGQTMAVTTRGEVWGWGCYKDKEGKKFFNPAIDAPNPKKDIKKQQNTPLCIGGVGNAVEVQCGSAFCIAKCANGTVYSWGLGECGELARNVPPLKIKVDEDMEYDLESIYEHHITPGRMYLDTSPPEAVTNVKAIGCGAYHSFVVCAGGSVYCCGLNNYAQLGLGSGDSDTESRQLLTSVDALSGQCIVSAKGGVHHSLVLTADNKILAFGRGDSGQLGIKGMNEGSAGGFDGTPRSPDPFHPQGKVISIACGGNHNMAVTDKNEIYSWGYGDMLALGHGEERDEPVPKLMNFQVMKSKHNVVRVKQVAAGGQHSAIIGDVLNMK